MPSISNTQDSLNKPQAPQASLQSPQSPQASATQQANAAANETARQKASAALSQEFQNFLTDIENLFKATTTLTGAELEIAKAKFNERLATAKVKVSDMSTTVAQQARDAMAVTDTYVHEQPWKAVGAATAIGFLLGFILARRN